MDAASLKKLFEQVKRGKVSSDEAVQRLRHLPFEDLGFANVDHHRALRVGMPEIIFGPGKSAEHLAEIFGRLAKHGRNVLATRVSSEQVRAVKKKFRKAESHELARAITLTPDTAMFLDEKSPAYLGGSLRFLLSPMAVDGFKDLTEVVRKGHSIREQHSLAPEHPMWVEFAHAMAPLMAMPANLLAKMLGAEKGEKWKVLSLAAGHGAYEIAIARQNPNAEVWGVDWPNVMQVAQENAKAAGVSDRYHVIPGSALEVEYGSDYDLVLLTNFIHHFNPETAERLLRKVQASLKEGGRAVILQFVPNEDRVSPAFAGFFALTTLVSTPDGVVYTFRELQNLLQKAGFRSSEAHALPPTFFSVVVGIK